MVCILAGCDSGGSASIEKQLQEMSLQEKVGMMFIVRPEALDPDAYYNSPTDLKAISLQEVNDRMRKTAAKYPMGGIILYSNNIKSPSQLTSFVADLKALPSHPLICIDEEGGTVSRLANTPSFRLPQYPNMGVMQPPKSAPTFRHTALTSTLPRWPMSTPTPATSSSAHAPSPTTPGRQRPW